MVLFTKDIDSKLFKQFQFGNDLAAQEVVCKIFNPYGKGTWYILNSDPEDPDFIWAIVDLFEVEIGSVSRSDLETIKVPPFGLNLERDKWFTPMNAEELFRKLLDGKQLEKGGAVTEKPEWLSVETTDGSIVYTDARNGNLIATIFFNPFTVEVNDQSDEYQPVLRIARERYAEINRDGKFEFEKCTPQQQDDIINFVHDKVSHINNGNLWAREFAKNELLQEHATIDDYYYPLAKKIAPYAKFLEHENFWEDFSYTLNEINPTSIKYRDGGITGDVHDLVDPLQKEHVEKVLSLINDTYKFRNYYLDKETNELKVYFNNDITFDELSMMIEKIQRKYPVPEYQAVEEEGCCVLKVTLEEKIAFASGGMMEAGKFYHDKAGKEYRFIGKKPSDPSKGIFADNNERVVLPLNEFGDVPKKSGMFGFFQDGGSTDDISTDFTESAVGKRLLETYSIDDIKEWFSKGYGDAKEGKPADDIVHGHSMEGLSYAAGYYYVTSRKVPEPQVGGFKLIYEKWSKLMDGNGIRGTIRTVPQNYYVASIEDDGSITFRDLEINTKYVDRNEVEQLWNNGLIPEKRWNLFRKGGMLSNGKKHYMKGDEGMYEGGESVVLSHKNGKYLIAYIDDDGELLPEEPKRTVDEDEFEYGFAYFPKAEMAKGGTIEKDTAIMPSIIAESVAQEKYLEKFGMPKTAEENRMADETVPALRKHLENKAYVLYKSNIEFRKKINASGDKGRDALYVFMAHWADAYLNKIKMEKGGITNSTTYVPNKDIKELTLVLNNELKTIKGSGITDGVHVKNKVIDKKESNNNTASDIAKRLADEYADSSYFDKESATYINIENVGTLMDAGYTEEEIKDIYFGYRYANSSTIKADLESSYYIGGLLSMTEESIPKAIGMFTNAARNDSYEMGLKNPHFNWNKVISKYSIDKKAKIIHSELDEWNSGVSYQNEYQIFIGDKVVIGCRAGRIAFKNGKVNKNDSETGTIITDGQFNYGYWGIVSSSKETIKDIAKMLLSQSSGKCNDIEVFVNKLGGIDAEDLDLNKIPYEQGGAMCNGKEGYAEWENAVVSEIEASMSMTRSDAQAMVEADDFDMAESWAMHLSAAETAQAIVDRSVSTVPPVEEKMEHGGKVKFKDKVKAISKNLEGSKVPAKYRKDYGKKYSKAEADEAAKKIAGSMLVKEILSKKKHK